MERLPNSNQADSPKTESKVWTREELNALTAEKERQVEERRQQRIQDAIENNPDKEPFDYDKFIEIYWYQGTVGGQLSPFDSERVKQSYKQRYYLRYPKVQTLDEFARELEELEAQSGN